MLISWRKMARGLLVASSLRAATAMAADAAPPEFASTIQGISLRAEVGTGIYGDELSGNLGGTSLGVRTFSGNEYLLEWDAAAEAVEGGVAFEHPFYDLFGAQIRGHAEGAWRMIADREISPLVGVGLAGSASAITRAGEPLNGGTRFNNLDGLGGVVGDLRLDVGAGTSLLGSDRSFVAAAQFLMEIDSPRANVPGLAFFGGGLRARLDLKDGLVAFGDAFYEVTTSRSDPALKSSTQFTRWTLSATAVKALGPVFLGLGIRVSRGGSSTSYVDGGTYATASPVDSRIWIIGGYSL
jgi:hypothetical protein